MLTILMRSVVIYLALIGAMRFLGKRQLGQLEPSEVVVAMLVADLAAMPMQDEGKSMLLALLPIGAVLGMEYLLSVLSMHSIKIRKLLCGKPVILMENGKFLQENMRKTRVTLDELISQLREKDVLDISAVQYAILETGGNISVFLYPQERPLTAKDAEKTVKAEYLPITIISDGRILKENLQKAGKDRKWLDKTLRQYKVAPKETFLLTVDQDNQVCFHKKKKTRR